METELISYLATPSVSFPEFGIPLIIIILGLLVLKGFALYKAARFKEQFWFWAILLLNTFGLLPGIYLFLRRNKKIILFEGFPRFRVRY